MTPPSPDPEVLDLLVLWEEGRAERPELTLRALCPDRPDLLEAAQTYLRALRVADERLEEASEPVTTIPGFEIESTLGEGAMGVVYLARDLTLGRRVAVKIPRRPLAGAASGRHRFVREARALAALNHECIVHLYSAQLLGDRPFLVMEYVPGGSLAEAQQRVGGDPARIVSVLEAVAGAVDYAHRQGVLHRDLKPSNILLDADGKPHVADFGVAALFSGTPVRSATADTPDILAGGPTRPSEGGRGAGTVVYAAPETLTQDPVGYARSADVWSLGVIAYEFLTGQLPYPEGARVPLGQPLPAAPKPRALCPTLDRGLEAIVLRCLAPDPVTRYSTAAELAGALNRWRRRKAVRRSTLRLGAAVFVLGTAVGFGITAWVPPEHTPPDLNPIQPPPAPKIGLEDVQKEIISRLERGRGYEYPTDNVGTPFRWAVGGTDALEVGTAGDAFTVETTSLGLLELVPRVPCRRFRFTAEVRLDHAPVLRSAPVGLYFGYRCLPAGAWSAATVSFTELGREAARKGAAEQARDTSSGVWQVWADIDRSGNDSRSGSVGRAFKYRPAGPRNNPGPWRQLTVEVDPTGALTGWVPDPGDPDPEPSRVGAGMWARAFRVLAASRPDLGPLGSEFDHQGGVGLYLSGCRVTVRRVSLAPVEGQ